MRLSLRKSITCWAVVLLAMYCVVVRAEDTKLVEVQTPNGVLTFIPLTRNCVRVRLVPPHSKQQEEIIYTESITPPKYKVKQTKNKLFITLQGIQVEYEKTTDVITYKNAAGRIVLQEKAQGRSVEKSTIQGEPTYAVKQQFHSPADEYIYGTGQFQDGYLNVRGLQRRLTQVNTQISIPFILSSKGYGLLWNNYGLTDFNPAEKKIDLRRLQESTTVETVDVTSSSGNKKETRNMNLFKAEFEVNRSGSHSLFLDVGQRMARKYQIIVDGQKMVSLNNLWLPPTTSFIMNLTKGKHTILVEGEKYDKPTLHWRFVTDETTFSSPVAQSLDYTVFTGNADEIITSYRTLTGKAPLMPQWALGYIHCRERYNTQDELLENVAEFRKRRIPIDVIVQDWQYWGKYGWNAMCFDEEKYPDPVAMMEQLHKKMNIKLMISVWSKVDVNSEVGKQMAAKGYYIPGSDWIDFFNPEAAGFYWKNYSNRLLKPYGIDAWWQDATEPENDDLQGRKLNKGTIPGEVYRNVFPMFVNRTIYEGLRKDAPGKRAMILTRSGFPGMQRYGAATWSGDVGHNFETLRRQITGGLGQMAAGLPWWTYDAGGFFRPGNQYDNKEYHEQFLRWLQVSTFLPLMRVHGYMSNTEPWRYGGEVERIFRKYVSLRYQLLPYIYSNAANITFEGSTLMRPLVMDFATDEKALRQNCEYMFGKSMLISPVVEAGVESWKTYLPVNKNGWIDFWTGKRYSGGQVIETKAGMETIPVFIKAGSIIPMAGSGKQYAADKYGAPINIHIYPGDDASFTLYEDEGDNYNYEQGAYSKINFTWNDAKRELTIDKTQGSFEGMPVDRKFEVVLPDGLRTSVDYSGKKMKIVIK